MQVDDITARSKTCTSAGKPAIQIDQYQGQDQATAAVVSGKDQAMLADSPVIAYAVVQTKGQLEKLGRSTRPRRTATWWPRTTRPSPTPSRGRCGADQDGTYKSILHRWFVDDGAISNPQVNPSS